MNKLKTLISTFILSCALVTGCSCVGGKILPEPKVEDSAYGRMFGVDANINMKTIDKYLDLKGVVYRDMRMLEDPIEYGDMVESNGDAALSGYIKGFEVIPFPYIAPVEAPEGTIALPLAPHSNLTSTSTVGFPLESNTSLACTSLILISFSII